MSDERLVAEYAEAIKQQFLTGHAREHAYRPALERLMSSFEDCVAVNDPRRSEHGNPDFIFLKRSNRDISLGHAEAKDVTVDLDKTVKTEQLRRYAGYNKLFLSNYVDFRFFKNGELYQTVSIGKLVDGQLIFDGTQYKWLARELADFLKQPPEPIKSGKRLALIMGGKADRIRKSVDKYLSRDDDKKVELEKMYRIMQDLLIHDLTPVAFADMYAQTLVYGLFIARYNDQTPDNFTRQEARELVSRTNPFLYDFFDHIAGPRFDDRLTLVVDELCEVFRVSDVRRLVQKHLRLFDFADEKDPIIHFYEDFLAEYDPEIRKKMGAYYTPVPVVRFIIREVDAILKRQFGIADGLADTATKLVDLKSQGTVTRNVSLPRVQILDPAVGTATFLNEIIKFIWEQQKAAGQQGRWPSYVEQHLLPRLYGFELMMVPYTIAHLKLGMTLQDTGIDKLSHRLGVYLTNTLDEGEGVQVNLLSHLTGLAETVSKEASEASKIKEDKPVMVIMGNPPYSGESNNKGLGDKLTAAYKKEPGTTHRLNERNPKWINDDYVKFIAFAENMISKNDGGGVVGMITNHGYLDNPTFRGMRWHLAHTFDDIYILDLHGNTKKKESAPDGGKDQNVFNIMQGVAIILAVKTDKKRSNQLGRVHHAELYGTRRAKFDALAEAVVWQEVELDKKMYYFANKNIDGKSEYDKGIALNELFITYGVGVTTAHDNFVISESYSDLLERFEQFRDADPDADYLHQTFAVKKKQGWDIRKGHENIQAKDLSTYIKPIAYRPFDNRYIFYEDKLVWRTVQKIMQNYSDANNMGLMVCRQQKTKGFYHALVHRNIAESSLVSNKTSEIGASFPLYMYHDDMTRTANLNLRVLNRLLGKLKSYSYISEEPSAPDTSRGAIITPLDVLDYVYGILYSPHYRRTYEEFLKTDFPRVPVPNSYKEFLHYAQAGKRLRELHLMEDPAASEPLITYPIVGTDRVEKVSYENEKVWINDVQYFGRVPEVAWDFHIGGYQPAQKWLKDRKDRKLSSDDIEHYQKIIKILAQTDKIMTQIDDEGAAR